MTGRVVIFTPVGTGFDARTAEVYEVPAGWDDDDIDRFVNHHGAGRHEAAVRRLNDMPEEFA